MFDTNRGWTLLTPLLRELDPRFKMIVCVRSLPWILDSFETLVRKNALSTTTMFSPEENIILCGKIDWLKYNEDTDSVCIIDFKTGKHDENGESLQLPIYQLLLKNLQKRKNQLFLMNFALLPDITANTQFS